jgi:hypothetical protein
LRASEPITRNWENVKSGTNIARFVESPLGRF